MKLKAVLFLATALAMPFGLAGCNEDGVGGLVTGLKAQAPLRPDILKLMDEKGMRKEDPILIRAFKEDNALEVWKRDKTGRFALLRSYQMCAWGGTIGPKIREGDKMTPEGFYSITPARLNPHSQFYLGMDVGYPNAFDRALGRTGAAVMVHGNCTASAGCFVVTDYQVEEIYALAREALNGGQREIQVQTYPFHLTATNLAKHRRNPNLAFWRNIKEGYDHFELTHLEPKVDVCDRHYVFDAQTTSPDSTTFNAAGACPAYAVADSIAAEAKAKQVADDAEFKTIVAEMDAKEKADADAILVAKLEAAKPKKPQPNMMASIFGTPATPAAAQPMTATVGTPINVPIPRASPRAPQLAAVAIEQPAPQPQQNDNLFGNIGNLFSFASPQPEQAAQPAAQAPVAQPAVQSTVVRPGGVKPSPAQTTTASIRPQQAGPVVQSAPAPAQPQAVRQAPAADVPWWQKLNPFGG
ncbi:MAG: L,D-transpeptidase family protein [Ancalomicrobiaceae bacterium]|nr:L,D-transpeptidase family protein [Ancalomicrobiaceae bacterium]